jgi:hypothetical protein
MEKRAPTQTIKIAKTLAVRINSLAQPIELSVNRFCELSIASICDMIENPTARVLPKLVVMSDAVKKPAGSLVKTKSHAA